MLYALALSLTVAARLYRSRPSTRHPDSRDRQWKSLDSSIIPLLLAGATRYRLISINGPPIARPQDLERSYHSQNDNAITDVIITLCSSAMADDKPGACRRWLLVHIQTSCLWFTGQTLIITAHPSQKPSRHAMPLISTIQLWRSDPSAP